MSAKIWLALAIISEVIATSSLKSADGFTKVIPSIIVLCGYSAAFYCLALALKVIPVGVAYAVWSGVGIVLVTLIAWIAFDQRIDSVQAFAMTLIVAGVLVLHLRG